MQLYKMKCPNSLRTIKHSWEQKCVWNLEVLWFWLELLDVIWTVLIDWSLHTNSDHWQHFQSVFVSLALGKIELKLVQNGSLGFYNKNGIRTALFWVITQPVMVVLFTDVLGQPIGHGDRVSTRKPVVPIRSLHKGVCELRRIRSVWQPEYP